MIPPNGRFKINLTHILKNKRKLRNLKFIFFFYNKNSVLHVSMQLTSSSGTNDNKNGNLYIRKLNYVNYAIN